LSDVPTTNLMVRFGAQTMNRALGSGSFPIHGDDAEFEWSVA